MILKGFRPGPPREPNLRLQAQSDLAGRHCGGPAGPRQSAARILLGDFLDFQRRGPWFLQDFVRAVPREQNLTF